MITLDNDRLSFSFPEIDEALRCLVEKHVQSALPKILAEDRKNGMKALRARYWFEFASRDQVRRAERQLLDATAEQIEEALRKKSLTAIMGWSDSVAHLDIEFQRTLRIPDDEKVYPLPAGCGRFPLRHVDDFKATVAESWLERGGVIMPMYQSEALWINFDTGYPFAVKIAAGKINAVTGEPWIAGLQAEPQNYLVVPEQPWLDGFSVSRGVIRQFVAMPLGAGYSVEEQVTGKADVGGIQIQVHPLKVESYFASRADELPNSIRDLADQLVGEKVRGMGVRYCLAAPHIMACEASMGLGAGGTMRQEIYDDPHNFQEWDQSVSLRCFVHLCNSLVWRQITSTKPPQVPLTSKEYKQAGIPWFDYYRDDLASLSGSAILRKVKSVVVLGKAKGEQPLPENHTTNPSLIIQYGNARRPDEVREWIER